MSQSTLDLSNLENNHNRNHKVVTFQFICNSLIASVVSNVTGIMSGHPLDTIKVRMQMETRKISARQCAYEAVLKEGPMSLMKGISQPLIGVLPSGIIVFGVQDYSTKKLQILYPYMKDQEISLVSGAAAGFSSLGVLVPLDLLKCRSQMTKEGKLNIRNEIKTIFKNDGIRGFYKGFWATAWRDVPGYAVYFSTYAWLKQLANPKIDQTNFSEENKTKLQTLWKINSGGCAGVMSWMVSMTFDIIKTKQQCSQEPLTMNEAYRVLLREGGIRKVFTSSGPTLIRGYIVNMVTLPMFDAISDYLKE